MDCTLVVQHNQTIKTASVSGRRGPQQSGQVPEQQEMAGGGRSVQDAADGMPVGHQRVRTESRPMRSFTPICSVS